MFASKEEVLVAMEDGAVCTVNTLTSESYEQGHITGSSLLPCNDLMHEMVSFVSTDKIAARLQEEAQHERIITYCGGGIAATVNAMAHLIAGNENVSVYDGSMSEWVGEGLPTTKGEKP
jgi:thiosulfate/3-mercaptopyruvate sulfurtransferase